MADKKGLRLTGLFKTKREGMLTGTVKPDQLEELVALINAGETQKNGLTVFMFLNEPGKGPFASLTVNSARPYEGKSGGGKYASAKPSYEKKAPAKKYDVQW